MAATPATARRGPDDASSAMDAGLMTPGMTEQRRTVVLFTPMRPGGAGPVLETPSTAQRGPAPLPRGPGPSGAG
jgi:hypothetical protein